MLSLIGPRQRIIDLTARQKDDDNSTAAKTDLKTRKISFRKQLVQYWHLHSVHLPGIYDAVADRHQSVLTPVSADKRSWTAEVGGSELWLPSSLPVHIRKLCPQSLIDMETVMREAECEDCLNRIRNAERAKRSLLHFRRHQMRGQRQMTRSLREFSMIQERSARAVAGYRLARAALLSLRGPGPWEEKYRVLQDSDVRGPHEFDEKDRLYSTQTGRKKTAAEKALDEGLGERFPEKSSNSRKNAAFGESHRTISWIWKAEGLIIVDGEGKFVKDNHDMEGIHEGMLFGFNFPALKLSQPCGSNG